MTPDATTLAYDRSLNREGLSIDQSENFFRVITPPLGSWRRLGAGWWFAIAALSLYTFMPMIAIFAANPGDRLQGMIISAPYGCLLAFVILAAITKLNRRFIFEIAHDTFTVKHTQLARSTKTYIYQRSAVTDIHASVEPGRLAIYIRGQEMLDLHLSKDRGLPEQVATELNRGMQIPMQPTTREVDGELSRVVEDSERTKRQALFIVMFAILGVGVILAFVIHPVVLWPIFFIASIPAGLAMGTQEKKFWV